MLFKNIHIEKKEREIEKVLYLYLLNFYGRYSKNRFNDSLIHLYRYLRIVKKVKLDKLFISVDGMETDIQADKIFANLIFHNFINEKKELTKRGLFFMEEHLANNELLNDTVRIFEEELSPLISYEQTCLIPLTNGSLNCGMCTELSCINNNKTAGSNKMKKMFKSAFSSKPAYLTSFSENYSGTY